MTQPAILDEDVIPAATAATPDLVCWIWAAFPPYRGHINKTRVAEALGVSRRTLGRWLDDAEGREFDRDTQAALSRRAILRGHGTYLWPDLDEMSLFRTRSEARNAYTAYKAIQADVIPAAWRDNTTLLPHDVLQISYERAHVFGVAVSVVHNTKKTRAKIENTGGLVFRSHRAENKYAALMLKHTLLAQKTEHRCIPPRSRVKIGRTETWREAGGPYDWREAGDPYDLSKATAQLYATLEAEG